jgi:Tol biopolymer transport system component
MAFEGGTPTKRFDIGVESPTYWRWAADSRSIFYTRNEGGADNIWSQPIAGGTPKQITYFNSEVFAGFDLSRDGKRLVMSRGTEKRDVMLIRDLR